MCGVCLEVRGSSLFFFFAGEKKIKKKQGSGVEELKSGGSEMWALVEEGEGVWPCYRDMQVLIVWVCNQPGCNRSAPAPLVAIYWERDPSTKKVPVPFSWTTDPRRG